MPTARFALRTNVPDKPNGDGVLDDEASGLGHANPDGVLHVNGAACDNGMTMRELLRRHRFIAFVKRGLTRPSTVNGLVVWQTLAALVVRVVGLQVFFLEELVFLLVFPLSSAVEELIFLCSSFSPSSKIGLPTSVTRSVSRSEL